MDNAAFRALVASTGKGAASPKQQAKNIDRGAVRALVNAELQRSKAAKKKKGKTARSEEEYDDEPVHRQSKKVKYRDRALERRTNTNRDYTSEIVQVDEETSKYLGGDAEHTHMVKGLDYSLLEKVRAQSATKLQQEAKPTAPTRREVSSTAKAVEKWLREERQSKSTRVRLLSYEYDVSGPALDAIKACTLPSVITRTAEQRRAMFDEDTLVLCDLDCAAAPGRKKVQHAEKICSSAHNSPPIQDDDIFQGAGKYLPNLRVPAAPAFDDQDDYEQTSSKYFQQSSDRQARLQGGPVPVQAPVTRTGKDVRRIHRDPIAGMSASRQPKISRNIDGTDVSYGEVVTYESDDETYAKYKRRVMVGDTTNEKSTGPHQSAAE